MDFKNEYFMKFLWRGKNGKIVEKLNVNISFIVHDIFAKPGERKWKKSM